MATPKAELKEFVHSPETEAFYSGSNNVVSPEVVKPLDIALVKKGECLKFRKNGERFWSKYETEVLLVKEIGESNLKVVRVVFAKKDEEAWAESDPFIIQFQHQLQYDLMECPKEEDKISSELIEEIKAKLKKK